MAKPAHTRVAFNGLMGPVSGPLEHWSFNVNFPQDVSMLDSTQALDDAIATSCKNAYNDNLSTLFMTDCHLTQVKVSQVLASGLVALRTDNSYAQGVWEGDVAGTQDPIALPLQTALCVSLKTTRPGPTGKGRFFLPWPKMALTLSDRRLTEAQATQVANQSASFLSDLAAIFVNPPQVVSSKGYMTEVNGVRVGRTPDTMRSRRSDLPEGYVHAPLA